ncbi:MAG TPA: SDR family NAD(P)-dependent oxidoreductase [Bacteroidetes bacterium]|nr:SDR family NAD(P)-dependent oxidoreductase [Bacteroidota bacterium]HIL56479.1 SDR family NAD(P)-dependent oxidoreductase [Rhodothermales bacterium]
MTSDLQDRIVLVTGASGRLGRIVVSALARTGARVVAIDRQPYDGDAPVELAVTADVTSEGDVASAFARVIDELGTPWGVIHTVGTWDGGPLAETSLEGWRHVLELNLTSAFLCVREAARTMTEGRVIGIASRQGADRAPAQQAAYAASKAGLVRLIEAASAEHEALACVAVAPSMILFGEEPEGTAGVTAEAIADLCVRLCGDAGAVHDGTVLRAYGDA